ncbi:MAG: site-specific integrase [Candidatus Nanopelagicales bacterium]|nr:site-specific integrase [Candidatus Nanopelagicales bacterium]
MSSASTVLLPFQPSSMSTAQLAAVSFLARYSGRTHVLYTYQLGRWFAWCESNGLDPLVGIQRAHVELYIRGLGDAGLMDSSINTMMHAVRGYFRFAHVDGLITADPAVYARLPKVQRDETRTQGLDRLELIRFLQVAQTLTVHHGALAYLLGINALRASEAAAVRIEDYADTLRGHRVLHLSARATNRPPCPSPSRCCACWRPAAVSAPPGRSCCARSPASRSTAATSTGWSPGSPRPRASAAHQPPLAAPRRHHQRPRRRRPAARRPDPGPACRPPHPEHYDRARGNLDRLGVHFLTAYVAGV